MSMDLVALRREVWAGCGMLSDNDEELPRTTIDLALNRALWELVDKFDFKEKEKTGTFSTGAGVNRYDMPEPFEALKGLYITNPDTLQMIPLVQMSPNSYGAVYNESEENWGFPTHYVRILEGCAVRLYPTPLSEYEITIKRTITLADITEGNNVPDLPQAWHELIGWGGLWRCLLSPIGDYNRSNSVKSHCKAHMNSMLTTNQKEKHANTDTAGLNVVGRDYDQNYDLGYLR